MDLSHGTNVCFPFAWRRQPCNLVPMFLAYGPTSHTAHCYWLVPSNQLPRDYCPELSPTTKIIIKRKYRDQLGLNGWCHTLVKVMIDSWCTQPYFDILNLYISEHILLSVCPSSLDFCVMLRYTLLYYERKEQSNRFFKVPKYNSFKTLFKNLTHRILSNLS